MINPSVTTGWVCIASSGPTVSEREIKAEWLVEMANSYDTDFYTATMWPEHNRTEPMGHVEALKCTVVGGITKLFALLKPNLALIDINKKGKLRFCSIEPRPNFAKSGKMYLAALGLTDSPDSTGTTALKFNTQGSTPRGKPMQWTGSNADIRDNAFFNMLRQGVDDIGEQLQGVMAITEKFKSNKSPMQENSNMDASSIIREFSFSFANKEGVLDTISSAAILSALVQASPLLARIKFIHVPDPNTRQFDGLKPGLRTGRKHHGRFDVKAAPSHALPDMVDLDSGTVFKWAELSQMVNRLTQQEANELLEAMMLIAVAEDILKIGFNGTSSAQDTDPENNPNGEDVARGWHQAAKDEDKDGGRVLLKKVVFDTKGGGDYADLDTMAYHLIEKLPEEYRNDPRLVVLVGGELLRAHKQAYIKPGQIRDKDQHMKIADMPAITNQNMPKNYFAITFMENLRVITLEHSERVSTHDIDDVGAWAMRYYRHSCYTLGAPSAYVAFDDVSISK